MAEISENIQRDILKGAQYFKSILSKIISRSYSCLTSAACHLIQISRRTCLYCTRLTKIKVQIAITTHPIHPFDVLTLPSNGHVISLVFCVRCVSSAHGFTRLQTDRNIRPGNIIHGVIIHGASSIIHSLEDAACKEKKFNSRFNTEN